MLRISMGSIPITRPIHFSGQTEPASANYDLNVSRERSNAHGVLPAALLDPRLAVAVCCRRLIRARSCSLERIAARIDRSKPAIAQAVLLAKRLAMRTCQFCGEGRHGG